MTYIPPKRFPSFDRNREIVSIPYDPGPLRSWEVSWIARNTFEVKGWTIHVALRRPLLAIRWMNLVIDSHAAVHFTCGPLVFTMYRPNPRSMGGSYRAVGVR